MLPYISETIHYNILRMVGIMYIQHGKTLEPTARFEQPLNKFIWIYLVGHRTILNLIKTTHRVALPHHGRLNIRKSKNNVLIVQKNHQFETTRQNAISEGYEEEEKTESREEFLTPKWYETFFGRLGLGVCFAALAWLLLQYLRKRR